MKQLKNNKNIDKSLVFINFHHFIKRITQVKLKLIFVKHRMTLFPLVKLKIFIENLILYNFYLFCFLYIRAQPVRITNILFFPEADCFYGLV